jgi:hypothetical protein
MRAVTAGPDKARKLCTPGVTTVLAAMRVGGTLSAVRSCRPKTADSEQRSGLRMTEGLRHMLKSFGGSKP